MENWEVFTAKTVSDALTDASVSLQVPSSMLEYEVLEESKGGILGLFSKPAKIRARKKMEFEEEINLKQETAAREKRQDSPPVRKVQDTEVKKTERASVEVDAFKVEEVAKKFLSDVLAAMKIEAKLSVTYLKEEETVSINMEGQDMGILIGKRGQTLDSLQYLTSLVINKENSRYLKVKLDTENYRERRRETLENLAKNIAFKVKRTKRPVSLEPMNPYERRIIHSTLQSDKFVETHSEGEEPYRKVVVTLKKGYREYNNNRNGSYNNRYNNNRKEYKKTYPDKDKVAAEIKTEEQG